MMARVPVVPALLISVAVAAAMFWLSYLTAERDSMSLFFTAGGFFAAACFYLALRYQAISMMEHCTIAGVMGSMFIIKALLIIEIFDNGGWIAGVVVFVSGIFIVLSPYLFKERWERQMEEWDRAADYWKQRRLERRKSTS